MGRGLTFPVGSVSADLIFPELICFGEIHAWHPTALIFFQFLSNLHKVFFSFSWKLILCLSILQRNLLQTFSFPVSSIKRRSIYLSNFLFLNVRLVTPLSFSSSNTTDLFAFLFAVIAQNSADIFVSRLSFLILLSTISLT